MTSDSHRPTAARAGAALFGALLVLAAVAVPVTAAGSTAVRLDGPTGAVETDETGEVAVVVAAADGGVGAYELTVSVDDPDVATVVDVKVAGDDDALTDVEIADDGSNASIRAALMDTAQTGEVTVATVTLAGKSVGSTAVSLSVETLGDEKGNAYTVTAEGDTSVDVDPDDRRDDDEDNAGTAGTLTSTPDAGTTDEPRPDDATATPVSTASGGSSSGDAASATTGEPGETAASTPVRLQSAVSVVPLLVGIGLILVAVYLHRRRNR